VSIDTKTSQGKDYDDETKKKMDEIEQALLDSVLKFHS